MFLTLRLRKKLLLTALVFCCILLALAAGFFLLPNSFAATAQTEKKEYIKWVDFTVPEGPLQDALEADLATYGDPENPHVSWVELLAYLGAKYGGDFSRYQKKATPSPRWLPR